MPSLDEFAAEKLRDLEARHLRRTLAATARLDGAWVERDGRRVLSFSCNDYLNLSQHPAVRDAAIAAIRRYGAGAGASRLVTGNHPLYAELEDRLARLKGSEAACVFGSGYLANIGIIPALIGEGDLVVIDELAHACLWAGARMSGAAVASFRHNDARHAAAIMGARRGGHRHALIATDGVFSMDGDLAPLPALAALAQRTDAWLLTDDAHGLGVLGGGRGSRFAHGVVPEVALQMGTLSKAVGSSGGYLCASRAVIDLVRSRARTLVYSTGLPPASVAASIAALDIIASDPDLTARPLAAAKRFTARLGLAEAPSPIVPIIIGAARDALAAAALLDAEGFLVVPIRPPTVPDETARLRLSFCAQHREAEIDALAAAIRRHVPM